MKNTNTFFSSIFISSLFIFLLSFNSIAQSKGEISFYSGYQMLGGVNVYQGTVNGRLDINDAAFYSGSIGFRVRPEVLIEVQYLYQPTKVSFNPNRTPEFDVFNADVHYILAGARYEKKLSKTATGYGGLSIGTAGFVPTKSFVVNTSFDPVWRFAFGLTLGAKFMLSKKIGVKLQTQGLFPVQWAGGGLYVGTGGAGFGVNAGTSIVQINVGGGLFYAF